MLASQGTSLYIDLRANGIKVDGEHVEMERCYRPYRQDALAQPAGAPAADRAKAASTAPAVVTLLRSPRAHVLSQWEECRYSVFGRNVSKLHPEFRERFESGTDAEGFDAWLSYFKPGRPLEAHPHNDYGCYNPRNMQTRALTCTLPGIFASHHDNRMPLPPFPVGQALAQAHTADVLGITELYRESICLVRYRATGQLPAECNCDSNERSVGRRSGGSTTHFSHTSNARRDTARVVAALPATTLQRIDALTKYDCPLYAAALIHFVSQVLEVERATSAKLLCDGAMTRLRRQVDYIPELHVLFSRERRT